MSSAAVVAAMLVVTPPLAIELKLARVTGSLTLDGKSHRRSAIAVFTSDASSYIKLPIEGGRLDGSVPPGTYRVAVITRDPRLQVELQQALVVPAAGLKDLRLAIATVPISGVFKVAGKPLHCPLKYSVASLKLVDPKLHRTAEVDLACNAPAFRLRAPAGTYRVEADLAGFPEAPSGRSALGEVTVPDAGLPGFAVDMKVVNVSGRVTLNGVTPTVPTSPPDANGSTCGKVSFTDAANPRVTVENRVTFEVPCTSKDFAFATPLVPGTHRVSVELTSLPVFDGSVVEEIEPALVVGEQGRQGLLLDVKAVEVSGSLSYDGAPLAPPEGCFGLNGLSPHSKMVRLMVQPADAGEHVAIVAETAIHCGTRGGEFRLFAPPGHHTVHVAHEASFSPLPDGSSLIREPLTIAPSGGHDVKLTLQAVPLTGTLKLTGAVSKTPVPCDSSNVGRLELEDPRTLPSDDTFDMLWDVDVPIDCKGGAMTFSSPVPPGTYRVAIWKLSDDAPLPEGRTVLPGTIDVR